MGTGCNVVQRMFSTTPRMRFLFFKQFKTVDAHMMNRKISGPGRNVWISVNARCCIPAERGKWYGQEHWKHRVGMKPTIRLVSAYRFTIHSKCLPHTYENCGERSFSVAIRKWCCSLEYRFSIRLTKTLTSSLFSRLWQIWKNTRNKFSTDSIHSIQYLWPQLWFGPPQKHTVAETQNWKCVNLIIYS